MSKVTSVKLLANEGIFEGLSKQNLMFHQCIMELVDNSIASKSENISEEFRIDIKLKNNKNFEKNKLIDVFVADNGRGMNLKTLKKALQLGESATNHSRLNEHGFGLKNSLATLTQNSKENTFTIYTRSYKKPNEVYIVNGPFREEMDIIHSNTMPDILNVENKINYNTIIKASVPIQFIQTLQGRGAKANNLKSLSLWLIEHLGVMYRGYLKDDYDKDGADIKIFVHVDTEYLRVRPLEIPFAQSKVEYLKDIPIGDELYTLEYEYGNLDKIKVNNMLYGNKMKFYYQQNQMTQGIDIILGKRTIATAQLDTIWRNVSSKGLTNEPLSRHNRYNEFVGELRIPEVPRNLLTTVNNKTNFNLDDPDWNTIFEKLNEYRPIAKATKKTEQELVNELVRILKVGNDGSNITKEENVWSSGVRIDIYKEDSNGKITIYEVKTGSAAPLDIYQLKMYWDGLLLEGKQPNKAILVCKDYDDKLKLMIKNINKYFKPIAPKNKKENETLHYNFDVKTHSQMNLK